MRFLPRYPIYVPSKGRYESGHTARFLLNDQVSFYLVVEQPEADEYAKRYGAEHILVLPFQDLGSVIPARNWIKDHATAAGFKRHWQLDDNIRRIAYRYKRERITCNAGNALAAVEDFVDRYENIAIAGLNYEMFVPTHNDAKPFNLNHHVYSCSLVLNSLPQRWRGRYNEDTDICLQVLAAGWCTVLINVFLITKIRTMVVKGGNTGMYQGDGRLEMARSLERMWPVIVKTTRKFNRPQHHVNWEKFDTPLKRRSDITISQQANDYGLELVQLCEVKNPEVEKLVTENGQNRDASRIQKAELDDGIRLFYDSKSWWHRIHFSHRAHCGPLLIERVRKLLNKDSVFVDVGANIGEYLIAWCQIAAYGYGFEISETTADLCQRNLELNNVLNAVLYRQGLSDSAGSVVVSNASAVGSVTARIIKHRDGRPAQVAALDDFAMRKLDLIKVDVEGHECAVLRGARQTIQRDHPILVLEVQQPFLARENESLESLHILLGSLGYQRFENAAGQAWDWQAPTTGKLGDVICFTGDKHGHQQQHS